MTIVCRDLDSLLARDVESERARERSWYNELAAGRGDRVVFFGAGNLGRRMIRGLRTVGVEPLALCDNNPALWGQSVEGFTVLAPEEAARRFRGEASFVVTIFSHGVERTFPTIRGQLRSLGCAPVVPFAALAWKHPDLFLPNYCLDLPHKVVRAAAAVREAYGLWADEASRREYLAQLRWRLALDFDVFPPQAAEEQYFSDDLLLPRDDEVFVDCGAFDGDTIRPFLRRRGDGFRQVVAFEPDRSNFERLAAYVAGLPAQVRRRIDIRQQGVSDRRRTVRFAATGNSAAAISDAGEVEITCVPLDELPRAHAPTYVKMDIEGAEPDALAGAERLIRREAPVLGVCVYHRQDHLWRIPLQIRALRDDYCFFLRRYQSECWEVVCYAVPRDRLRPGLLPS
jgi:FkbM family methyltransferase